MNESVDKRLIDVMQTQVEVNRQLTIEITMLKTTMIQMNDKLSNGYFGRLDKKMSKVITTMLGLIIPLILIVLKTYGVF